MDGSVNLSMVLELNISNFGENLTFHQQLEALLGPVRDPLITAIPMTIVYTIIFVSGFLGNVCTCIVIKKNKYMHNSVNFYLFSLAVSDLLLLILGLPQDLWFLWNKYPYAFGKCFCLIRAFTSETCTNASILTITAFTVERYLAICHPLKAHTMPQLVRAVKIILIIWIISAFSSIPIASQLDIVYLIQSKGEYVKESATCKMENLIPHIFEISAMCFFVLPMTVISILYILIGIRLKKTSSVTSRTNSKRNQNSSINKKLQNHKRSFSSQQNSKQYLDKRRSIVKMLVAIVFSFFICWSPFHIQRVMAMYWTEDSSKIMTNILITITHISGVSYYLTATINPILYQLLSLKFRIAFRDTFGFWFLCLKPDNLSDLTYSTIINCTDTSIKVGNLNRSINGSFKCKPSSFKSNNIVGIENIEKKVYD